MSDDGINALLSQGINIDIHPSSQTVTAMAIDFVDFSRNCWFGTFDIERFRVVDGDLAIGERSISDAPDDELQRVSSTAVERHLAINWLRGYSEIYSETDTST